MKSGIYCIEINNKVYVGSAIDLRYRFHQHEHYLRKNNHQNIHLQRAYNKYGEAFLNFKILEHCEKEKLLKCEQFWIDWLRACNSEFGFNVNPTAGSNLGRKFSEEVCAKMRKPKSKEARQNMSKARQGMKLSNEHKNNIGKSLTGKKRSTKTEEDLKRDKMKNYTYKMFPHKYFKLIGKEINT